MKILLLGLGPWGYNHLRVLRLLPVEIFAVDTDEKKLNDARAMGLDDAHLSLHLDEFIDQIDAALVVTPAATHVDLCRRLLKAGKDVFVEKPIALSSLEAKSLVELAQEKGLILQVGHIFRYDAASQWMHTAMRQGQFGQIKILQGNFSGFKSPRQDIGIVFNQAIHFVDLFNYVMGRSPSRVWAQLKDFLGRGMEDEALITMDYEGAWAKLEASYHVPGKHREIVVMGTHLSVSCDFAAPLRKIKLYENKFVNDSQDIHALKGFVQEINFSQEEPLLTELRAFVQSIQTRTAPIASGCDGYESIKVLEAVMASAKSGVSVELK